MSPFAAPAANPRPAGPRLDRLRLLFSVLLVFLLLPLFPASLSGQTDLTGFWVPRIPTGDGNLRETFLDLNQSGETVTGKILPGFRDLPISEGTFKDGRISS